MQIQLMNVKKQHEQYASEYEEATLKVLRSGVYIGGEEVEKFEKEFASYQGAEYAISCASGTDALVLALRALRIGKGDEVITVPWTFFATVESIMAVGATPVFVDVCEDTYCINPDLIENAITDKTKAVLPVHFYGNCCNMAALWEICRKHELFLITDCAQATGTKYKGERKNILGDVSCFSFFPTKNLGCAGDGGMILTDNKDIAFACQALKVHGSGEAGLYTLQKELEIKKIPFPDYLSLGTSKYYNYIVGYNSRLDAIQAAILRRKMVHIEEFIIRRRENAEFYNNALQNSEYGIPFVSQEVDHSYYIYSLKHPKAKEIIWKLKMVGIACGIYYPVPLHLQGALVSIGYTVGDFPVTERLSEETFAIPVYPELTVEERKYIVTELKRALND